MKKATRGSTGGRAPRKQPSPTPFRPRIPAATTPLHQLLAHFVPVQLGYTSGLELDQFPVAPTSVVQPQAHSTTTLQARPASGSEQDTPSAAPKTSRPDDNRSITTDEQILAAYMIVGEEDTLVLDHPDEVRYVDIEDEENLLAAIRVMRRNELGVWEFNGTWVGHSAKYNSEWLPVSLLQRMLKIEWLDRVSADLGAAPLNVSGETVVSASDKHIQEQMQGTKEYLGGKVDFWKELYNSI